VQTLDGNLCTGKAPRGLVALHPIFADFSEKLARADPMAHAPRQAQAPVSAAVGATKPFSVYETEEGTPGQGTAVRSLTSAPTTQYSSAALEASGRSYLRRPGGEHDQRRADRLGRSASRVVLQLPAGWGARTQTLTLGGSTDGTTFTTLKFSAAYTFDPNTNTRNTVTLTFPATTQR
jgi:hypothetical protein